MGFTGVASLMEFIRSGKGGLGTAGLLLAPHDPELPFSPGSRGSDDQHTPCCREHPISHIPYPISYSPYPASQFSYPIYRVLYPASNILYPCILHPISHHLHLTPSVLYPCILHSISFIPNPASHIPSPASHYLHPTSCSLASCIPPPVSHTHIRDPATCIPNPTAPAAPLGDANPPKPKEFGIKPQLWSCSCYAGGFSVSWLLGRTSPPAEFRDDINGTGGRQRAGKNSSLQDEPCSAKAVISWQSSVLPR